MGYQLKDTATKYLEANLKIMNQLSQLKNSIYDNEKEIDSIKINELVESLEEFDRKFDKEFDQLQKQYADNNNLELIN